MSRIGVPDYLESCGMKLMRYLLYNLISRKLHKGEVDSGDLAVRHKNSSVKLGTVIYGRQDVLIFKEKLILLV